MYIHNICTFIIRTHNNIDCFGNWALGVLQMPWPQKMCFFLAPDQKI